MLVAERKPINEILESVGNCSKIMILGCRGCVTNCLAGGEKEVEILASQIRLYSSKKGKKIEVKEFAIERQCNYEFFSFIDKEAKNVEAIISMACGVGVQTLAEYFSHIICHPALNTKFIGANLRTGEWLERCRGCGHCKLHLTGGICPITRCSKGILNGPCGGSQKGKCEISEDVDCGWQLIYERLKKLNQLDLLTHILPANDWSTGGHGGPRKVVREEMLDDGGK